MIGRPRASVVGRATVEDILRLRGLPQPSRGFIHCPHPLHRDEHPSAHVLPSGRGVKCFGCGWQAGLLDFAVALGLGHDRRSAARELEERLR